jgi:hypothetical protein
MNPENQAAKILLSAGTQDSPLRPTELYNEGWMLRLILDWCSREAPEEHPLYFLPGAGWASEGLLPTQFCEKFRKDPLSESRTHADGIIGHFAVGSVGTGDVALDLDAKQLIVVEAKMFSPLSGGTKHAAGFDQAARNAACMAELLFQAGIPPDRLNPLAFYVAAPGEQIENGKFTGQLDRSSVKTKVESRVKAYGGEKDKWFEEWFLPTLEMMKIGSLVWEDLVALAGSEYVGFYERCIRFNKPKSIALD